MSPDSQTAQPPIEPGLFDAANAALLGGRCRDCGALRFPRRPFCAACQRDSIDAVPLSSEGRIYTYTIVRHPPPGYRGHAPYALGYVELAEGLRIMTTIAAEDLDQLQIGDKVAFDWLVLGDGPEARRSWCYRKHEAGT